MLRPHGVNSEIKRFTEYGANLSQFAALAAAVGTMVETDLTEIIVKQLRKQVTVLDLTDYQKHALQSIGISTIGNVLSSTEQDFQKAYYIGPKRSRKIMNVATAAVLEYLSG